MDICIHKWPVIWQSWLQVAFLKSFGAWCVTGGWGGGREKAACHTNTFWEPEVFILYDTLLFRSSVGLVFLVGFWHNTEIRHQAQGGCHASTGRHSSPHPRVSSAESPQAGFQEREGGPSGGMLEHALRCTKSQGKKNQGGCPSLKDTGKPHSKPQHKAPKNYTQDWLRHTWFAMEMLQITKSR